MILDDTRVISIASQPKMKAFSMVNIIAQEENTVLFYSLQHQNAASPISFQRHLPLKTNTTGGISEASIKAPCKNSVPTGSRTKTIDNVPDASWKQQNEQTPQSVAIDRSPTSYVL